MEVKLTHVKSKFTAYIKKTLDDFCIESEVTVFGKEAESCLKYRLFIAISNVPSLRSVQIQNTVGKANNKREVVTFANDFR